MGLTYIRYATDMSNMPVMGNLFTRGNVLEEEFIYTYTIMQS